MTGRAVPDEGFLRRWARRKAEGKTADAPADEAPRAAALSPAAPGTAPSVFAASAPAPGGASASGERTAAGAHGAPSTPGHVPSVLEAGTAAAAAGAPSVPARLPTLDDAEQLTPDADFSAFVARGVDAAVRRTALKKLFADPHFNAMDGLDVYIGDYTQPSPVSDAMLASLAHARQVLRRTVDADAAPPDEAHPQRQQPPEPGHDEHPPDRRTDDA